MVYLATKPPQKGNMCEAKNVVAWSRKPSHLEIDETASVTNITLPMRTYLLRNGKGYVEMELILQTDIKSAVIIIL